MSAAMDGSVQEPELFAITPGRGDLDELLLKIPLLAAGGVARFLLRELSVDPARRRTMARALVGLCRDLAVELWIARDVELANEVGAHGVHLSERCPAPSAWRERIGAGLPFGLSLHRPVRRPPDEISAARHAFLGPVYPTSKDSGLPLGAPLFVDLAASLATRVFALGGIGEQQLSELSRHGIRRVAAIRYFFDATNPRASAEHACSVLRGP